MIELLQTKLNKVKIDKMLTKQQFLILIYLNSNTSPKNFTGSGIARINKFTYSNVSINLLILEELSLIYPIKINKRDKNWCLTKNGEEIAKNYVKIKDLIK